ncbi:MAG: hypothetical protein HDS07_08315, partial [Bacteroides sp.]|nr:hypothetical protein [Bacteroides sp.]
MKYNLMPIPIRQNITSFYDREERPVLTISDTHRGETLLTATTYNLASQPLSVGSS